MRLSIRSRLASTFSAMKFKIMCGDTGWDEELDVTVLPLFAHRRLHERGVGAKNIALPENGKLTIALRRG
jgi:hypothetical protein